MIEIKCPECGEETSLPESYDEERFGGEVKRSEGGVRLLVAVIKKGESKICGNTMKKTLLAIIILGLVLSNSVAIAGASPDLTEAGKKYIAENFGIDGCWVYSGLTWDVHGTDNIITPKTGGTAKIMSNLQCVAADYIVLKTPRTGTYYLSTVEAGNDGNTITDADVTEILANDGYPAGKAQYCICAIPKEVKEYIAKNYGDGNCVTATCPDAFDLACMLRTLTTPLPTGYTSDMLCSGQILDWVYANNGWCISGPIHNINTGVNFSTIQAAINSSDTKDGHTITVDSGTYNENVNVTKRLTLKGIDTGGGKPVVYASRSWSTITLSADGIILEGFKATGASGANARIELISNHNTVRNNNACTNYGPGILLSYSNNNTISGNTVSNNGEGCYLEYSNNNTLTGNTFVNDGLFVHYSYQNTVDDNTVNGKPLVYLEDASDIAVTDAGQVILVNCNNITVENLDLSNTTVGVELWTTDDSKISNNDVSNSDYGIYLYYSSNNTLASNNASNNQYGDGFCLRNSNNNAILYNTVNSNRDFGIYLIESHINTVSNNTNSNNYNGIRLDSSNYNNILNNTILSNVGGIRLHSSSNNNISNNMNANNDGDGIRLSSSSDNNTISKNSINLNDWKGIDLRDSRNNKIYLNNFRNNTDNVYSYNSTNIWHSTEKLSYTYNSRHCTNYLGNYWSDYVFKGNATNGDGIGDTPYSIYGDIDRYPLMVSWENYFAPPENNFDTGPSEYLYPSISGTHNGTIKLTTNILVHTLFTYPCPGTGGHTEYVRIWNSSWAGVEAHWNGYQGDWNNISFNESFILFSCETYNYTIRTGSYPQVHHIPALQITNGWLNYTEFVDANGKNYNNRIPAIRFFSEVQLTAADNGTQIELKKGQSLLIRLEGNPTTGYTWDLVEPPEEHILRQVGAILVKPESNLFGAGGVQTIRFDGVGTGQTALKLVYHCPWETDVAPEELFYIHVVVNG